MTIPLALTIIILSFVFWLGTRWAIKHEHDRRTGYQEKPTSLNVVLIAELVLVIMTCCFLVIGFIHA